MAEKSTPAPVSVSPSARRALDRFPLGLGAPLEVAQDTDANRLYRLVVALHDVRSGSQSRSYALNQDQARVWVEDVCEQLEAHHTVWFIDPDGDYIVFPTENVAFLSVMHHIDDAEAEAHPALHDLGELFAGMSAFLADDTDGRS